MSTEEVLRKALETKAHILFRIREGLAKKRHFTQVLKALDRQIGDCLEEIYTRPS